MLALFFMLIGGLAGFAVIGTLQGACGGAALGGIILVGLVFLGVDYE